MFMSTPTGRASIPTGIDHGSCFFINIQDAAQQVLDTQMQIAYMWLIKVRMPNRESRFNRERTRRCDRGRNPYFATVRSRNTVQRAGLPGPPGRFRSNG